MNQSKSECAQCERLQKELDEERAAHAATLARYRVWKNRCEKIFDEIKRLKDELQKGVKANAS